MDTFMLTVVIALSYYNRESNGADVISYPGSCPQNMHFESIPSDHLYHSKKKPLIIAHRGQPMKYQENTLDGIASVEGIKADGYELDIYKTKDDQLVVFHDDDTLRMTGVKKVIWESTFAELRELNIKKSYKRGEKTYVFDRTRKIPLLEEVLNATRHTNLLHYLEMKPSRWFEYDDERTRKTSKMVADMVTRLELTRRAFLVSFDIRKVHMVKSHNPRLTVGTLFTPDLIPKPTTFLINEFPDHVQCFLDAPYEPKAFFKFMFDSGLLFKLTGSSSFDCNINLYNDSKLTNNTIAMMHQNYSPDIATGFYTMYSMWKLEAENKENEIKLKKLLGEGLKFVVTDNVPRLRTFLGKD